jgi:2-keto-4-pentenoate hydratase
LTDTLLRVRQGQPWKSAFPELSWDEAYEVQARVLAASGDSVGGWKVALGPGGVPVAAPLFASSLRADGAELPMPSGRPCKLEVEMAFHLAQDLPPRVAPYTREAVLAAIDAIHPAFEVVGARCGEPGEVSFAGFLGDNLGNAFTVLGKAVSPQDAVPEAGSLEYDGRRLAEGTHPQGDPLVPLLHWVNRQVDRLGGLRRGQVVITGSYTGASSIIRPGRYEGHFAGRSPVAITFQL